MKPSSAPSKVMDVLIKAAEYMEIPIRRSDAEPLQKLFMLVRSELNLDLKNIKQEQAKFWKQHPALVKTELLLQAHLTRETATLTPELQTNYKRVVEIAPRLIEKLMKMAVIPRTAQGLQLVLLSSLNVSSRLFLLVQGKLLEDLQKETHLFFSFLILMRLS